MPFYFHDRIFTKLLNVDGDVDFDADLYTKILTCVCGPHVPEMILENTENLKKLGCIKEFIEKYESRTILIIEPKSTSGI